MEGEISQTGAEASRALIESGVLGSLVVLLSVGLFLSMRGWLRAKDAHLEDKDRAREAALSQATEAVQLANEMNKTVDAMNGNTEKLFAKVDALATANPNIDRATYYQASSK